MIPPTFNDPVPVMVIVPEVLPLPLIVTLLVTVSEPPLIFSIPLLMFGLPTWRASTVRVPVVVVYATTPLLPIMAVSPAAGPVPLLQLVPVSQLPLASVQLTFAARAELRRRTNRMMMVRTKSTRSIRRCVRLAYGSDLVNAAAGLAT